MEKRSPPGESAPRGLSMLKRWLSGKPGAPTKNACAEAQTVARPEKAQRNSLKGAFQLFYRQGWAYLVVTPPRGNGLPVYPEEIENRMKVLGIPHVPLRTLRLLVEAATGEAAPLVEWPQGKAFAAEIRVALSEDRMSASATVRPPRKGAAPPSVEEVLEALAEAGVRSGVDACAIEDLVSRQLYDRSVKVARGAEPIPGHGPLPTYHFNTKRGKPYLEMEFGRINLRELAFVDNCTEGQLLAELSPALPAVDGFRVTGEVIPAEVDRRVGKLSAGLNTRLSEDGLRLYASCDGNVRLSGASVLVEPVLSLKQVDYETGNIHFDGTVVVEGEIVDGFQVEATGDIEVGGAVGKATLVAGGSVLLKKGTKGNGEGVIRCEGDLFARYLEGFTVFCAGNVVVEEAIMHSKVRAGGHCALSGRRARVIAGDIVAGGCFWCKSLGNPNEAPTRVSLGIPPLVMREYREAEAAFLGTQEEVGKVELQLDQLEHLQRRDQEDWALRHPEASPETLRADLDRLRREYSAGRDRLSSVKGQLTPDPRSFAVIEEWIYKGAVVGFGLQEYVPSGEGFRRAVLRPGVQEVSVGGFNPSDQPLLDFSRA